LQHHLLCVAFMLLWEVSFLNPPMPPIRPAISTHTSSFILPQCKFCVRALLKNQNTIYSRHPKLYSLRFKNECRLRILHILRNTKIKRKRIVILPNYLYKSLVSFKCNTLKVVCIVLIGVYNWKEKVIIALKNENDIHFEIFFTS